jgi:hypothetical protein
MFPCKYRDAPVIRTIDLFSVLTSMLPEGQGQESAVLTAIKTVMSGDTIGDTYCLEARNRISMIMVDVLKAANREAREGVEKVRDMDELWSKVSSESSSMLLALALVHGGDLKLKDRCALVKTVSNQYRQASMVKWASFEEKLLTVATEAMEKETAEISCKIKEKEEVRVRTCMTKGINAATVAERIKLRELQLQLKSARTQLDNNTDELRGMYICI